MLASYTASASHFIQSRSNTSAAESRITGNRKSEQSGEPELPFSLSSHGESLAATPVTAVVRCYKDRVLSEPKSMGAWGIATFEDDSNLDWLCDLEEEERPLAFLKECLNLKGIKELEYMHCTGVLCAAVMIDAILNGATKDLPESAIAWLENNKKLKVQKLLPAAIEGLDRVLGDKSEMNETWAENADLYPKWKKHVNGIKKRLSQSLEASRE